MLRSLIDLKVAASSSRFSPRPKTAEVDELNVVVIASKASVTSKKAKHVAYRNNIKMKEVGWLTNASTENLKTASFHAL